MNDVQKEPTVEAYWVCTGYTYSTDHKEVVELRLLDADKKLTERRGAFRRTKVPARPGHVYRLDTTPDGKSVFTDTLKWMHLWENDAEAAAWQAAGIAFDQLARAKALEKKAKSVLDNAVTTLADAYSTLAPAQRLPFELWLLNRIRAQAVKR